MGCILVLVTSIKRNTIPDIVLSGQPVIVDFIYGTCTTICPVFSASFSNLQRKLGLNSGVVRLLSITIDSEKQTIRHPELK